jgi:hypothetical protein
MSKNIPIGSYVWYKRKDSIAKVIEYDRQSDSYTIEYKGRIIDTTNDYIDGNIASRFTEFQKDKLQLKIRIAYLEHQNTTLENLNKEHMNKNKVDKNEINLYISSLEEDRLKLENDVKSITEKMYVYRDLYEKSIKSLLTKEDEVKETIICNNLLVDKTDKFLWNDQNNYAASKQIDLYKDFSKLKEWLRHYFSSGAYSETYKDIENWLLQKHEMMIGVYYSTCKVPYGEGFPIEKVISVPKSGRFSPSESEGGGEHELIFYTNYGNVVGITYYNSRGFFSAKEVSIYKTNKILSPKMINIINKSVSSGLRMCEDVNKKTAKELYDFICEVTN